MNGSQSGVITPNLCGSESNGNEGIFDITQSSRVGASSSDVLVSYPGQTLVGGLPPSQRYSLCIQLPHPT